MFTVLDISDRLNALADEDEKLRLAKVSGKILVKLTKDDGSGRPGGLMFPVLVNATGNLSNAYTTAENSLEGAISSRLGQGFEYRPLTERGIGPKMTFFNPTSTNYEYLYEVPISFVVPKNRKNFYSSTSQEETTVSIFKKIMIFIYGPDGITQSFMYWTGNLEMSMFRKEGQTSSLTPLCETQ
jgi:hypothetical protein